MSLCPELGVSSCGESPMKALEMLKEAVELYLEAAKDLGILPDFSEMLSSSVKFQATFEVDVA